LLRHSHGETTVTAGGVAAAVLQRNAIAAIVSVVRIIAPVYITLSLPCGEQKTHNSPTMKTLTKIPIPSFLIALILALACIIGLVPKTEAVSPPPDGGYPGGNTAEGQKALQSLTTGGFNTAVGYFSLFANTIRQLQYRCWCWSA
jgi:hypothetical protein